MKEVYIETKFGKMFYKVLNEEKINTLVFLHGWGMSSDTFDNIVRNFSNYKILVVDFLGFGKSSLPLKPLTLDNYVSTLYEVIINEKIENIIIVGHSFGARVGIRFSEKYKVKKLFLINGKALKNKSLKFRLKIWKYKLTKAFLYVFSPKEYQEYIKNKGSSDYKKLSNIMKKTFVKIVNFDLTKTMRKLKCQTIIMGSVYDDIVSFKETGKIYKNIPNSQLYTFYKSKHFSYLDEEDKVVGIIRKEISKCL